MKASGGTATLGKARSMIVNIMCPDAGVLNDPYPLLSNFDEAQKIYTFKFLHSLACSMGDGTDTSGGDDDGLDTGGVMLILMTVGIVLYCSLGAAFMYFKRGARGIEMASWTWANCFEF